VAERSNPITERGPFPTRPPQERAFLVSVDYHKDDWTADASLEELARLSETAGLDVVGSATQNLKHPHPNTYVGKGKLEEIAESVKDVTADVVIFDDELAPAQLRNIENRLEMKVLDRTALILDIFARRAITHEGRIQVELAQLEYRLPRLTRMWTHLERQAVGGVGLRGPGETQLEIDRRLARTRISQIKAELADVHRHRELYRSRRRRNDQPVVAIVGYTNAGKSTLLNRLTNAGVLSEDQLFATLDPTTRRVQMPNGRYVLLTDTVGFINHLPTSLIAAFRATLEEIAEATVVLHVLDISHPNAADQADTVREVLDDLKILDKPTITALNKIDLLDEYPDAQSVADILGLPSDFVPISAHTGAGIEQLMERIQDEVIESYDLEVLDVTIPYDRTELVNLFHRAGKVEHEEHGEQGTQLRGELPRRLRSRFEPFILCESNGHGELTVKPESKRRTAVNS